jgi:TPR repeat protein
MRISLVALAVSIGLSMPAAADPLHDGTEAFRKNDYKTAMALLAPLAAQGDGRAECMVTVMRDVDSGKSESYSVESIGWKCVAATYGKPWEQFSLGTDYYSGDLAVKQDYGMAAQLIQLAAEQGLAPAQNWLGDLYERGQGVAPDLIAACHWWGRAARQDNTREARRKFGTCYLTGTGVPQDDIQALLWWGVASRVGNFQLEDSVPYILHAPRHDDDELWETIVRRVPPEKLPALQGTIRNWKPVPE